MSRYRLLQILALLFAFSVVAAACGSDDDEANASDSSAEESTTTTAAPDDTSDDDDAMDDDSDDDSDGDDAMDDDSDGDAPSEDAMVGPAEMTSIATTCAPAILALGRAVAVAEGFFADHNLDVECVQIGSGPETAAALIGGDAQYASNVHINTVPLVAGGADVVMFVQAHSANLFDIIVDKDYAGLAPEGSGWEEVVQSLEGTRVGVVARNAAAEDIVRFLFDAAGVDPESLTYVAVGLDSVTPLIGNEIDWSITFDPNVMTAVSLGEGVRPFELQKDEGPPNSNWPGSVFMASRAYVDDNPDVICGIIAAHLDAHAFMQDPANRDRVIEIASELLSAIDNPDLIAALVDQYTPGWSADGKQDPAIVEVIGQVALDAGKADRLYTADDYVVEPDCS